MTTPLVRAVARKILIGDTAYVVTLSAEHLSVRRKGARSAKEIPWDALLARGEYAAVNAQPTAPVSAPGHPPRAVLDEIARDLRAAAAALSLADDAVTQAGALPASVMLQIHGDPERGRPAHADHWFVEPLLTIAEVGQLLRLSTRAVRRLGLRTIRVGGEERYQQSELREYLRGLAEPR